MSASSAVRAKNLALGIGAVMAAGLATGIKNEEEKLNPGRKIGRFSPDVQLHHPIEEKGIFKNPWSTWQDHGVTALMSFFKIAATEMRKTGVPHEVAELDQKLPIVKPDFTPNSDGSPKMTWIGHATVLLQMDGVTVLTDPIWSTRCSPSQSVGTSRYRTPPCTIEDLPKIDAVVISHNHYDHLDVETVKQLNKRFGAELRWYVPKATKRWMECTGCKNVVEMNWWEEDTLPGTDIVFAFTPSQHWCKRGLFDYCKQLWGSWCVISPRHRFFFGGDTGYCEGFKEIGEVYGPFDVSAIPIGAYEPRWFMKFAHVNPEEAIQIHQDIKSRKSMGIHWGTFVLTTEYCASPVSHGMMLNYRTEVNFRTVACMHEKHYLEPPKLLGACLEQVGLSADDFCVVHHGGSTGIYTKSKQADSTEWAQHTAPS